MQSKIEYLAVINPISSLTESAQHKMLAPFQPAEFFVMGKDGGSDQFIRLVRPPRVVLVVYPALLTEQRGSANNRRDNMVAIKVAIHKRGSYIQEVGGRHSNKHWSWMKKAADKMCGRLAQGRKSVLNAKRGAKPWTPTRDEKDIIREEWYRKPGRTVDDVIASIRERLGHTSPGRTVLYREFDKPVIKRK